MFTDFSLYALQLTNQDVQQWVQKQLQLASWPLNAANKYNSL